MLTTASGRARWRLADHVRACLVDEQVILLDLNRNKYLAVGSPRLRGLAPVIDGWPAADPETEPPIAPAEADTLIAPLLTQGLLTREPASAAVSTPLAEPVRSLDAEDLAHVPFTGWRRPARLLRSAVVTALWLRSRSLADIAAGLAARQVRMAGRHPHPGPRAIEDAVATYGKCRPFLLTAYDRCLHDSLTLVHFLAGEGLPATWIVGVRTRPFGAHAWVQRGAVVLNDQHEHVRRYRPILVV